MQPDPFGNLTEWGPVLDTVADLADKGALARCQPGLVRILRHKVNWRLREEVLKRVGQIQTPSDELVHQVIAILDDDNIYYDARILAGNALAQLLPNVRGDAGGALAQRTQKVLGKLKRTPQPPFFDRALTPLCAQVGVANPSGR